MVYCETKKEIMKIELFILNAIKRKTELLKAIDIDFVPRTDDIYFDKEINSFYKVKNIYFSNNKICLSVNELKYRPELSEVYKAMF